MDGRIVGKTIREFVRPTLRSAGFTKFTDRKAWRFNDHTIDMIAFRSFSAYIAGGVGCTTYSFALESGVFYRCLDPDLDLPETYHLTFRFNGSKTLRQPWFRHGGSDTTWDRPDVWYVLPDGTNLQDNVQNAQQIIQASVLPLIERFATPGLAYQALLNETSRDPDFGSPGIWMPGNPDSPHWRDTVIAIGHANGILNPRQDMQTAPVLGR